MIVHRGTNNVQGVNSTQSIDYNSLANSLSQALGEPEDSTGTTTTSVQKGDSVHLAPNETSATAIAQSSAPDLGDKASDSGISSEMTADTPQPTVPSDASSMLDTGLDRSVSDTSFNMTEEEQAVYLKGECTLLELLKEEYQRSQAAAATQPQHQKEPAQQGDGSPRSLLEEAVEGRKAMPVRPVRPQSTAVGIAHYNGNQDAKKQEMHKALTQSSSTPELGAVTKPQRLVSPVPDKTIR